MSLVRWSPMREMMRLRNDFDRLFEETMDLPGWQWSESLGAPAVDVAEKEDAIVVKASLPGIKPEELDVSIKDNVLTIKGEVKDEKTISEGEYHMRERRYGAFNRTVTLPSAVDVESVEANYEDGVLTLTAPKTDDAKIRRITVSSVEPDKMIEGETA